jgi:undecaprenyl-diphosphatase
VIENADLAVLTFLTGFSGKSSIFDHLVNAVARLDLFKGLALMCLFWFTWAHVEPNQTLRGRDERHERLVNVVIGSLLMVALARVLQLALHWHQRPLLSNLNLPFPLLESGALHLSGWNSFPSDHSMLFFALSTGLWTVNRQAGAVAFAWSLLVVDIPRIYLGIHYPSDVMGGAILGITGMVGFLALPLSRLNNAVSAWRNTHHGAFIAVMFFVTDELAHLLDDLRELAQSTFHIILSG